VARPLGRFFSFLEREVSGTGGDVVRLAFVKVA
jgi:hypothetical protein